MNDSYHPKSDQPLPVTENAKLAKRMRQLETCVEDAADSYNIHIEQRTHSDLWFITIESEDCISNQGEKGEMFFTITLGPRGGLRSAKSRQILFGGKKDYLTEYENVSKSLQALKTDIKNAV